MQQNTGAPVSILIVEDDAVIANLVAKELARWGYLPCMVEDFSDVMQAFYRCRPQLVLMDIALPYYNGYYWCTEIRKVSDAPVVFISSRTEDMDIVMAMQMGGDDYLTKPFSMEVLVAKLQAVLRRTGGQPVQELEFCGARLSLAEGCLYTGEGKLELTKNELRILQLLLSHKGRVVSREEIMLRLWDSDSYIDDNTLTVNMNRLRRKLEPAGLSGCIVTRKGEGYQLTEEQGEA